jgi:hypothetical protein
MSPHRHSKNDNIDECAFLQLVGGQTLVSALLKVMTRAIQGKYFSLLPFALFAEARATLSGVHDGEYIQKEVLICMTM